MDNDWCTVCDKHVDVPGKLYCSQACRDSDIGDAYSENGWHTDCSTRYGSSVSLASSIDSSHSSLAGFATCTQQPWSTTTTTKAITTGNNNHNKHVTTTTASSYASPPMHNKTIIANTNAVDQGRLRRTTTTSTRMAGGMAAQYAHQLPTTTASNHRNERTAMINNNTTATATQGYRSRRPMFFHCSVLPHKICVYRNRVVFLYEDHSIAYLLSILVIH
ncbi:hypothetical protein BDF22DRAFT_655552 [Syncephalis plumigaleata]|nr:hypothetical protein BDF22DRAFT_655552 [Syncephalis plumigaleata]